MSTPSPGSGLTPTAARARIAALDIEIEREQCHQALVDYKFPISTLPSEIMSEIFVHFLPPHPKRPELVGPESPSFLLQICRRWRDVALATPALWSTMRLHPDVYNLHVHVQQRQMLDLWLQRSQNCPLSIELRFESPLFPESPSAVIAFVETILRHAARWQEMNLFLPYVGLSALKGSMPLLRSLTLGHDDWPYGDIPEDQYTGKLVLFTEAPHLEDVVLSQNFNSFLILLPWSQLTTLHSDEIGDYEAVEILRNARALEACTLSICDTNPEEIPFIPPLTALRTLALRWSPQPQYYEHPLRAPWLLNALTLPALQSLCVSEHFLGPDPVASLSALWPGGEPDKIVIEDAQTPLRVYASAFPRANLSVYRDSEDEDESEDKDESEDEDESQDEDEDEDESAWL